MCLNKNPSFSSIEIFEITINHGIVCSIAIKREKTRIKNLINRINHDDQSRLNITQSYQEKKRNKKKVNSNFCKNTAERRDSWCTYNSIHIIISEIIQPIHTGKLLNPSFILMWQVVRSCGRDEQTLLAEAQQMKSPNNGEVLHSSQPIRSVDPWKWDKSGRFQNQIY